ncbi:MAG: glycosyltransferase family 4 protein [Bryobacteraceae bacterium]|nr:glycosyltransferase family 4 protein [Bryobacteraceae bacterium]
MNLCYICSEYPPFRHGGVGSATQVFARAFAARGHKVRVVGLYPADSIGQSEQSDDGIQVTRLPASTGRMGFLKDRMALYRTVAKWARAGEIDAVEVPDWEGQAAGWPSLPVPVIVRLHGSLTYFAAEMNRRATRVSCLIESNSFHRADYCSSTSRYTAGLTEKLFGAHASRPKILYNFVDVPATPTLAGRAANRVVFAGSLVEKKGVIPLMKAWGEAVRLCPGAELHVYGKDAAFQGGSMQEHLKSLLPAAAASSVIFHGHVTRQQVAEAFRSCRAAVFPSFSEAFSLVPLEAMAEGCPVIFSKRHSGPELITPESDGLLVEPSNPSEISRAIVRLLEDGELAGRFGQAGSRMIRSRFSREALIRQHESFFETCMSNYRRSASQMRALSRVRFTAHA